MAFLDSIIQALQNIFMQGKKPARKTGRRSVSSDRRSAGRKPRGRSPKTTETGRSCQKASFQSKPSAAGRVAGAKKKSPSKSSPTGSSARRSVPRDGTRTKAAAPAGGKGKAVKKKTAVPGGRTKPSAAARKTSGEKKPAAKTKRAVSRPASKERGLSDKLKVGQVTHFFSKIMVCVVRVTGRPLKLGDRIVIVDSSGGRSAQTVTSLQVESRDVKSAKKGQLVGMKLERPVRLGAGVYLDQAGRRG